MTPGESNNEWYHYNCSGFTSLKTYIFSHKVVPLCDYFMTSITLLGRPTTCPDKEIMSPLNIVIKRPFKGLVMFRGLPVWIIHILVYYCKVDTCN